MANELEVIGAATGPVYATLQTVEDALMWNGSSYEPFAVANFATYMNALTESPAGSNRWLGDFPNVGNFQKHLVVYYSGAGSPSDTPLGSEVMTPDGEPIPEDHGEDFISLIYLKTFMQIEDTDTDGLLTILISAATDAVKSYCRRDFWLKTYNENQDGCNTYVILCHHVPIGTVTQVTVNQYVNPVTIPGSEFIIDSPTGQIRVNPNSTFAGSCPRYGFRDVNVQYSAGYSAIPNDLQMATAMIAQGMYIMRGTVLAASQEKIEDYEVTYRVGRDFIDRDIGVKTILDRYRDFTI
jgi:hypothetical protein